MNFKIFFLVAAVIFPVMVFTAVAEDTEGKQWKKVSENPDPEWYKSEEARQIALNVLFYQHPAGGWPKNIDMHMPVSDERRRMVETGHRFMLPTIDNDATFLEIAFMARMFNATGDELYAQSFRRAMNYLFDGQYPNGGWPQFFPNIKGGYSTHITYNDDAMVQVMEFMRAIRDREPLYADLVDDSISARAAAAFDKGIDCILKTQIVKDGKPTVWCQQHDEITLEPAPARSYELPSFTAGESCPVLMLLMSIENPSPEVIYSVKCGVEWLENHKIEGFRKEYRKDGDGQMSVTLVEDSGASPIWARFYDLETEKPFVCDRDGIKKDSLEEIGLERRNGYNWFSYWPVPVLKRYKEWIVENGL